MIIKPHQVILKPSDSSFKEIGHSANIPEFSEEIYHFGPHFKLLNYLTPKINKWVSSDFAQKIKIQSFSHGSILSSEKAFMT